MQRNLTHKPDLAGWSWSISGLLVTIPDPLGKKSLQRLFINFFSRETKNTWSYLANRHRSFAHLPTKFSKTLLFPALWLPTTAIWGRSILDGCPIWANASCILFITGIRSSIPLFPIFDSEKSTLHRIPVYKKLKFWEDGGVFRSAEVNFRYSNPEVISRTK